MTDVLLGVLVWLATVVGYRTAARLFTDRRP
jgi:hypothetical protein